MSKNQSENVEVILTLSPEHYEIIQRLAGLYGAPVEEYVLAAAKSSISTDFECEAMGEGMGGGFSIHKRLGGDEKGGAV